jgi:hypothetical protein
MSKKSVPKTVTVIFIIVLSLLISVFANPVFKKSPPKPKADCTQTTDADIAKTLYDKIKTDKDLSSILPQINFSVTDKNVIIEGWVAGKDRKKAIEKIVKNTECVKKVKNKLKDKIFTGCPPGQKRCGDICIDKASTCTNGN